MRYKYASVVSKSIQVYSFVPLSTLIVYIVNMQYNRNLAPDSDSLERK